MAQKKKITVYADGEHEVVNTETGELLHHSDSDNIVYKNITVEELFEEPDEEKEDLRFIDDTTYIRNFRGNGVLFREYLTPQETQLAMFLGDFVCYQDCTFYEKVEINKVIILLLLKNYMFFMVVD